MNYKRSSGIILHPTSFRGPDGIGDLGPEAYQWIDFLAESGCSVWQILPLGPTGYGDSPYQSFSAFAGNPYLVSPVMLLDEGLLKRSDLADRPSLPEDYVDYGPAIQWKLKIINRACNHFINHAPPELRQEFEAFEQANAHWLADFTFFMAIKEANGGVSWNNWPAPLRRRDPKALRQFHDAHPEEVACHSIRQFLFFRQWQSLHQYANEKGIQIMGDIPIFVAYDSSDAWSHAELFYMDKKGSPTVVAGVPPDYFSSTGQLWGNPLYHWDVHEKSGFLWWIQRIRAVLSMVDIVRLDHFRGFAGYWEVPAGLPTAELGHWVPGPNRKIFEAIQTALGSLPIIAEDLGEITPDVIELRDHFGLPGMKVLHFAFDSGAANLFLPHNYTPNYIAYTGTHDNDTTVGWFQNRPEKERDFCCRYLGRSGEHIAWDLIRAAWSSVAIMSLAPLQDFLELGSKARMNMPGRPDGNWTWRIPSGALTSTLATRIHEFNEIYGRLIAKKPKPEDDLQKK